MVSKNAMLVLASGIIVSLTACSTSQPIKDPVKSSQVEAPPPEPKTVTKPKPVKNTPSFAQRLSYAAKDRTRHHVRYDGRYVKIGYPWGDVPQNIGVCTDVVIRSYRKLGVDLQQQVHKDIAGDFYAYPNLSKWSLKGPDRNIDHRRVYNLKAFFKRHGYSYPISYKPEQYKPGDIVTWIIGPGQEHIGIVVDQRSKQDPKRHMIVHNIAEGPKMEDVLFRMPISGHYRYYGQMRFVKPPVFAQNSPVKRTTSVSLPGIGNIPSELLR